MKYWLQDLFENVNEKLKGWRGIILSWLGVAMTYAESVFQLASNLLMSGNPLITQGGWKAAAVVAALITAKNILTDVGKK